MSYARGRAVWEFRRATSYVPFHKVVVVVNLLDGPITVLVTTTGGGCDSSGCPLVLGNPRTPDEVPPEIGIVALVASGNDTGGLPPRGALALGVNKAVELVMIVGFNGFPGAGGAAVEDEIFGGNPGGNEPVIGCPLLRGRLGVVMAPCVVVTRVLNRVGGAILFSHCVVPLMTE